MCQHPPLPLLMWVAIIQSTEHLRRTKRGPEGEFSLFHASRLGHWSLALRLGLTPRPFWLSGLRTLAETTPLLLTCTPQALETCIRPAWRLKKQPGVSNRDINGLIDWEAYISEAGSWRDWQDMVAVLDPKREGSLPIIGGTDVRLA